MALQLLSGYSGYVHLGKIPVSLEYNVIDEEERVPTQVASVVALTDSRLL